MNNAVIQVVLVEAWLNNTAVLQLCLSLYQLAYIAFFNANPSSAEDL
jgi:hypothetical protein